MRKILLATTALVAVTLAGAAQAAPTSPISLNVGGYVDAVAGLFSEPQGTTTTPRSNSGFETEYKLNFDAMGKGSNGLEYGANVSLWNGPEVGNLWTGGGNTAELNSAYVWMKGAFGKVMLGDEHGATDLFVSAPTVGEGQIDGRYMDFTSPTTLARFQSSGVDDAEHGTKIAYYTPKIGNDTNKVQVGVSYEPNQYNYGSGVSKYQVPTTATTLNGAISPYKNVYNGAVEYWGNFHPVSVAVSAVVTTANAGATGAGVPGLYATAPVTAGGAQFRNYTTFGLGTQVGFNGFTVGGSYVDEGHMGTVSGQNKSQDIFTLGGKYEFDKVAVAASWLTGEGYDNLLAGGTAANVPQTNYVSSFDAYAVGGTYTWFPGLTTNADAVFFNQGVANQKDNNDGYVFLVSQKLTF